MGQNSFDPTVYIHHPAYKLINTYNILSTAFIVLIFMNMLIAIINNTIGDVFNAQKEITLQQHVKMFAEYASLLNLKESRNKMRYMFIITPATIEDNVTDVAT